MSVFFWTGALSTAGPELGLGLDFLYTLSPPLPTLTLLLPLLLLLLLVVLLLLLLPPVIGDDSGSMCTNNFRTAGTSSANTDPLYTSARDTAVRLSREDTSHPNTSVARAWKGGGRGVGGREGGRRGEGGYEGEGERVCHEVVEDV